MTSEWCQKENVGIGWLGTAKKFDKYNNPIIPKHQKRVRCPKCKKRFETFTQTCSPFEACYHLYMPKHKKKAKKRKLASKTHKNTR